MEPRNQKPGRSGRNGKQKPVLSLARDFVLTTGSRADWPYFARWHYRSHNLGIVRFVTVLWHGEEPIGICVFCSPPLSLRPRNKFFGRTGRWTRLGIQSLNRQLVMLSRVVLHPTFRGAGIAAAFIRKSCEACPWPWIETLTQMGRLSPFFEKAGFVRVGVAGTQRRSRKGHSAIYGGNRHGNRLSQETHEKSRYARPIYYVFDNRENVEVSPQRRGDAETERQKDGETRRLRE